MTRSSELRSQIAEAQTRIADLEHQLTTLRAHETRLKKELGAIVYPILTIPAEITAEILCHAVADSKTKWLLAATSVCRLWRNIALSTPRLWNNHYWPSWYTDPAPLLQLWLSRSGRLPLNLTVFVRFDGERILAAMTKHISRWCRVDLVQKTPCGCIYGSLAGGQLPSLALHGDVPLPNLDAASCPKWRTVILCGSSVVPSALLPMLSNVTCLKLDRVASDVVSRVLPYCTALETLSIESARLRFPPIVLPLVHTLHHHALGLLHNLSLPALKNLRMSPFFVPPLEELEPFLTRSGCTLQMVHLAAFDGSGVLGFLRAVPSVLEFIVDALTDFTAANNTGLVFLSAFAAGEMFPDIEKIRLLYIPRDILPRVHSAVHRKISLPTSRLKKLTVELHRDDVVTESLRASLAENGVELEVLFHDNDW
ncbi:hypothetical protein C8F01DRAFT_1174252 [Mycena amicta]|nr:hypothetical protein C8F01DRAFT_1174252 [Mycena amicta]